MLAVTVPQNYKRCIQSQPEANTIPKYLTAASQFSSVFFVVFLAISKQYCVLQVTETFNGAVKNPGFILKCTKMAVKLCSLYCS